MTQERITPQQLLESVPRRNQAVRVETDHRGHPTVLYVPIRKPWILRGPLGWILPFSSHRAVALDPIGREVWESCDGEQNTERIIEHFADRHHLTFHEARISVMQFLRELTQRGLVVMLGPDQDKGALT